MAGKRWPPGAGRGPALAAGGALGRLKVIWMEGAVLSQPRLLTGEEQCSRHRYRACVSAGGH